MNNTRELIDCGDEVISSLVKLVNIQKKLIDYHKKETDNLIESLEAIVERWEHLASDSQMFEDVKALLK